MSAVYYKPSGRFSPVGLATALGIGLVATFVASWIYGYTMAWIPLVYLNVLLVGGYGFAVGSILALGISMGKIRNVLVAVLLGLVVGLFALYCGWVTWIYAMSSQELLVWDPLALGAGIVALGQEGVWTIKGSKPTGWFLYSFWIIEALIVLGLAVWMSYEASDTPFCEDCEEWMESEVVLGVFKPLGNPSELKRDLELEKLDAAVSSLEPDPDPGERFTVVQAQSCAACNKGHLLTILDRSITYDKEGNAQSNDTKVVHRLIVAAGVPEKFQQRFEAGTAPPEEPREVDSEEEVEQE